MAYIEGVLSVVAAIVVAEFVFFWPILTGEKATGLGVLTKGSARRKRSLAQILDRRGIAVQAVFRGESWRYRDKGVVFLDSDAHDFSIRLFDHCRVRVSLFNCF